jgi:hypothetical protein
VSEELGFWLFGMALSAAMTAAVGQSFVHERGRRVIPALCIVALLLGLLIGYALNGYIAYVSASAARF